MAMTVPVFAHTVEKNFLEKTSSTFLYANLQRLKKRETYSKSCFIETGSADVEYEWINLCKQHTTLTWCVRLTVNI